MADEKTPDSGTHETHDGDGSGTTSETVQTPPKRDKLTFTPEQQEKLNELIDKGYAKGFTRAKEEAKGEFTKLFETQEATIADLKAKFEEATKAAAENASAEKAPKVPPEEMQQLSTQVQTLRNTLMNVEKEKAELLNKVQSFDAVERDMKTRSAFEMAAADIAFIDANEEYQLLKERFGVDEQGEFFVKHEKTGRPVLNAHAEPMTLTEFLSDYAQRKPHKVKAPDQRGGTGASETRQAPGSQKDIARMSPDEFRAFVERVKMGAA